MRRWGTALAAIVLASAGLAATVTTANAATPPATTANTDRDPIWGSGTDAPCDPIWGSGDKTAEPTNYRPLENIRAGQHACFDRLVFDVRGTGDQPIGYRVGYVNELRQDGSGDLIKVGGGAILEVRAAAPSYDPETGGATYQGRAGQPLPGVNLTGFKTFKDARFGSSFEGDTQIGLGVRARLPFRVTQTANHLVVDVAHSWTATR
ncbi:AMIN-like domain-containing (lipo)protein [Streptomyces youssoufiensis]